MTPKLQEQLSQIQAWLNGPTGSDLWDVLTALRGPDSPSERPNMPPDESRRMYVGRRDRKFKTVEVIRGRSLRSGACRYRADEKVILPPSQEWDHFDKHVARAAQALGLRVETKEKA